MSWTRNSIPIRIGTPTGSEPAGYMYYDSTANTIYISEGTGNWSGFTVDVFQVVSTTGSGTMTLSGAATTVQDEFIASIGGTTTFSGTGTYSLDTADFVYAASGSSTYSGSATAYKDAWAYVGSGISGFYGFAATSKEDF